VGFDQSHYVPIILTKRGERSALTDLASTCKDAMTPLFVVNPVDWNFDDEAPAKTIDAHLIDLPLKLAQSWGTKPAMIDLLFIEQSAIMSNGDHPLVWLTAQAAVHGLPLVPVTSIDRDATHQQAVRDVHARDGLGASLRLPASEFPSALAPGALNAFLAGLGVGPGEVDLVLDLGDEVTSSLARPTIRGELTSLPLLNDWRTLTVAGASFPKDLSGVPRGISEIDRAEWLLYQDLAAVPPASRTPTFADYVIAHPDPSMDVDPRVMSISAALRYTTGDIWLVFKGELFKGRAGSGLGAAAVTPLASALVADNRFAGIVHCTGDVWFDAVASGQSGSNPEQWRRHGTVHHLTTVTDQVANLFAPSTGHASASVAP
jgi:hypothetical protein